MTGKKIGIFLQLTCFGVWVKFFVTVSIFNFISILISTLFALNVVWFILQSLLPSVTAVTEARGPIQLGQRRSRTGVK